MTRARVSPAAGHVNVKALPRGPNGWALCRRCSAECPGPRRTFCGQNCMHEWKIRTQPGYVRRLVFKRDAGQCALCPAVCTEFNRDTRDWQRGTVMRRAIPWEADHIVPVVEGGCRVCHVRVTRELRARMAERRRAGLSVTVKRKRLTRKERVPNGS